MPDNKDFRLGAYSGLLAVIMVIALTVMAFMALDPAPMQMAQNDLQVSEQQPHLPAPISKLDSM